MSDEEKKKQDELIADGYSSDEDSDLGGDDLDLSFLDEKEEE